MNRPWADLRRVSRTSGWRWACSLAADRVGVPGVLGLWSPRRVETDVLLAQIHGILLSWGMEDNRARPCAERIVFADLRGIDSHGAAMMPFYHERFLAGQLAVDPDIQIVQEGSATALVDGGGGLGHLAGAYAMQVAIDKAREFGVGVVAVRNSWHFGAASAYAADALAHGMIGLATTGTPTPSVLPTAGAEPRLGTNPIAFAAPGATRPPFLLDMATSTVSRGKLLERWRRGRRIPAGWALDRDGLPVTDGHAAFRDRRLTPLGGTPDGSSHKGYGLAVMVEILSNLLSGTTQAGMEPRGLGHFFLALDPARFRSGGDFGAELDVLLEGLRSSLPIESGSPVQVAGDPEEAIRTERARDGIPLSRHVFEDLRQVAEASGAPFVLE